MKKASGSYYTPDVLADFLLAKASAHWGKAQKDITILEPSCGDGSLLRALNRLGGNSSFKVDAVELSASAIKKARAVQLENSKVIFHNCDFLKFPGNTQYQLCFGNPPYIKRKLIKSSQKARCRAIHTEASLKERSVNNIWTAFLIRCAQLLSDDGVLAFILPAELLQVKFAQEIQGFLKQHFTRIEIYTFKELVFGELGQDIIALIAVKNASESGVYFGHIEKLSEATRTVQVLTRSKAVETSDMKWAGHVLSDADAELLLEVARDIKPVSNYCSSCAGIVTAANDFFIVSDDVRNEFLLKDCSKPIVQRGQFVNGSITFDQEAFRKLKDDGKPCFLIDTNGKSLKELNNGVIRYLRKGRYQNIHKRFKCTKRNRWYDVPSVWSSHAFFFKRSHLYPKLLLNESNVLVTDAAYRISVKNCYSLESFVFSFYNTLTMAMAELGGRFYGGGVLELTPNEFKKLPLPYVSTSAERFVDFKNRFHSADGISGLLTLNDNLILRESLNLSEKKIQKLQQIRFQLIQRRLRSARKCEMKITNC